MTIKHIALVGHCGFDSSSLSRFAKTIAPDAQVCRVNDQNTLDTLAGPGTLLLINRVLDGQFDVGGSGIDLVRAYAAQAQAPLTMLISNYPDAQQEAQQAGALPGFGKSQVGDHATQQRIVSAIASVDVDVSS